jgi:8-oxo-dGTP pyrophosphatase MutT (NUDIX family)
VSATFGLTPELVAHAQAFAAEQRVAVEAKDAATTVLLRDTSAGPEVYLLRRHAQMAFAAGMYAFPGGRVDPRDPDELPQWSGPTPVEWAERLSCTPSTARALVCAAVRETFEESGVLLAGPDDDTVVADTTAAYWEADRHALVKRSLGLAELLNQRGLVLRSDLLQPWARWITPAFEPRRYDTRFFVAALPAGQQARDVSGEADRVAWMRPADAVAGVDSGELAMLPPTYVVLSELCAFAGTQELLAAAVTRTVTVVEPEVRLQDGRAVLVLPAAGGVE